MPSKRHPFVVIGCLLALTASTAMISGCGFVIVQNPPPPEDNRHRPLAGGPFDTPTATRLGIAEILVTFGAGGCDLYLDGERNHLAVGRSARIVGSTRGNWSIRESVWRLNQIPRKADLVSKVQTT